jgi:predicted DNA-binding transcriptional regulator YafY
VQLLRRRRFVTAAQLAERLEVSPRTIYRDIQDLMASGVPVLGEAGVGYRLEKSFELPPLMFTLEEIDALVRAAFSRKSMRCCRRSGARGSTTRRCCRRSCASGRT